MPSPSPLRGGARGGGRANLKKFLNANALDEASRPPPRTAAPCRPPRKGEGVSNQRMSELAQLREAKRRSNPCGGCRQLDCFASLAMTGLPVRFLAAFQRGENAGDECARG